MSDIGSSASGASVVLDEPFHGRVGLSARRAQSGPFVHLVVSIERSWDADILINVEDTLSLVSSLGGSELHMTRGETVDGEAVVLVSKGDRLAITILDERISDVFVLRTQLEAVREHFRAAAA